MPARIGPALAAIFVAAGAVAWTVALLAAPFAFDATSSALAYAIGGAVCHQSPERSFHLAGAQLPVCARCTGLYAGAAIGAVAWAVARTWTRWRLVDLRRPMLWLALPSAVTVATGALGWSDPANALRCALAMPLGLAGGAIASAVAAGDLR